ncbi:MAG: hypothetical protein HOC70_05815 [Gammaproteobacteria bacterium]|jgi:hypothetical protein|nr:hypothetical protein [Gammaproteobacteria bacterium]MBT4492744.1 hypothetical protein [Gammaproteobacteria bacterium]MBT7369062.1 hypothetical protein [Gammaproteobacteria bacterium]
MSENMICPACNAFQPKAEECVKCGVIIAKASQVATPKADKPPPEPDVTGGLPVKPIAIGVVLIFGVAGFLLTQNDSPENNSPENNSPENNSPENNGSSDPNTAQKKPSNKLTQATAAITQANTRERMRALITKLNFVAIEDQSFEPPTNEQGLNKLVQDGLLTKEDITDAWSRDFVYEMVITRDMGALGKEYEMRFHSAGADGITGNADDIGM